VNGKPATIANPRDAKALGIETIYQTLALADNLDAPANVFLGREVVTWWGTMDDGAMEDATRKVMGRLNPNFTRFTFLPPAKAKLARSFGVRSEIGQSLSTRILRPAHRSLGLASA